MEFVFNVLTYIGGPIKSYTDYHRKLEGNVNNLKRKVNELNDRMQDFESEMEAETRRRNKLKKEVENWFEDVRRINTEVDTIEEKFRVVSYFKRAHLGELVCQKIEEVETIYRRGNFPAGVAVDGPPASGVKLLVPNLKGEIDVKEQIWEYLMGDEVGMIGVCGMGGIGKTTIMKHINNQLLKERGQFEKVIWVTVSKELNVFKLQKQIADSFEEDLPEGELVRAAALRDILEGKRYVLILDDVWKWFSLLDVGIPESTLGQGKKIVLTSRSIEVCQSMGCEVVEVQPLSKAESMNLFLDHVGHNVLQNKNLVDIVSKIVEQCGRLLLAIVTTAVSMKGVDDPCEWRNALKELRERVKSVKGLETEIFEHLKFSYDRLEDSEIQNCFLYCSLYPEDYRIEKVELIESWIDEGLLDGLGTRQAMYDRGCSILNKLEKNCLLERAGDYVYLDSLGESVKMHDVLRDMAIYIVRRQYMVKAGEKLEEIPSEREWTVDLEKVSLMKSQYSKSLPHMSPRCPHLSTLLLQGILKGIPESFFEHMPGLKVLNLSSTFITELPNSISNLKNLNALILAFCWRLQHVPSLAELRALRKLDLYQTAIQKVPHGIELLENLTCLRVSSPSLQELPVGILPMLSHLQCLMFCQHLREEVGKLRKLELLQCSFCDIQEFEEYAKSLQGKWPTNFQIRVGAGSPGCVNFFRHPDLKLFLIEVAFVNCEMEKIDHIELPNGLSRLGIEKIDDFNCLSNIPLFHKVTELKSCLIRECEGIDCVVDLSLSSLNALPNNIEDLGLFDLGNLTELVRVGSVVVESISHASAPLAIFSSLKWLHLTNCSKIRKLFPVELLQGLQNLEHINVYFCMKLEEIIASEEEKNQKGEGTTFILPKLKILFLMRLPALKSICGGGAMIHSLQQLRITDCPELKRLFPCLKMGNHLLLLLYN